MSCVGCTIPASTLSVIWPNSSPSPAQPSIVPLPGRLNEAKAGMRHIALKIQGSWPLFVRQHGQPCHSQYNVRVFPGWPVSSATITMHADTGRTSMTLHEVCGRLLPPQAALHLDTIAMEDHGLTLDVAVTTPQATCPDCTQPSTHIHSDYLRTLTDLPWATTPVTLHLRVRRFWCATPSCGRQTFAERVPQIAPHYARATARLTALQTSTGLALGGTAGARHLARQGAAGSRNTLLRRVRRLPTPAASRPCAIGIDDWAKRKGHTYGTIVVDLDRRCPVDLLADRTAETVAAWLQAHPEVTVVARDRAEAYASGVTQGAPDAVQVADRWHLMKHLREAVEAELCQRPILPWSPPLPEAASLPPAAPVPPVLEPTAASPALPAAE